MAMEMAQGEYNPQAIEDMNKKLNEIMSNQSGAVKIVIQYLGVETGPVLYYQHWEHTTSAKGRVVDTHSEITKDSPLTAPIAIEIKGTLTTNKDGSVEIKGQFFESNNVEGMDKNCPPTVKSLNCTFKMMRKRVK